MRNRNRKVNTEQSKMVVFLVKWFSGSGREKKTPSFPLKGGIGRGGEKSKKISLVDAGREGEFSLARGVPRITPAVFRQGRTWGFKGESPEGEG